MDVGGGHGALLAAILDANSQARGVLLDLPSVVAGASALRSEGIAGRYDIIGGDFFDGVPEGGDAYLLKGVIHDATSGLLEVRAIVAGGVNNGVLTNAAVRLLVVVLLGWCGLRKPSQGDAGGGR